MASVMIMGTGSGVGKSLIVAGLCRAFSRRGLVVRPFKPQNMSNNAAVTADGGEIGRAQALQARAAGVEPSVHMNPVLLKPQSDVGAQVVVHGEVVGTATAREYHGLRPGLLKAVMESFAHVSTGADLVIVEGAGSPAEVNLRENDIANMGFAREAGVASVLVGDVDRGGVIASLAGTVSLLEPEDRRHLRGFMVNRFRGDPDLFESAIGVIESHTSLESLGVLPFFSDAWRLPAEDSADLGSGSPPPSPGDIIVVVPMFPRIANFDDLDPLRMESGVSVQFIPPGRALPVCDLIVLPGSKAVVSDLEFCRGEGWDMDIRGHVRRGGSVVGLCGGYQMLGRVVRDPHGVEGGAVEAAGFGLLDVESVLHAGGKTVLSVEGVDVGSGEEVRGYEIHAGRTSGEGLLRPMLRVGGLRVGGRVGGPGHGAVPDAVMSGAVSGDGLVRGCYVHGLFVSDGYRRHFLSCLGSRGGRDREGRGYDAAVNDTLDTLADLMEHNIALDKILAIAEAGV